MRYENICRGRFLARPNRFVARVEVDGAEVVCHVKNTGRCRELLVPGVAVYLEQASNPKRKTACDLVAVEKGNLLINMDAQAPNKVFGEFAAAGGFLPGLTALRPEHVWEDSRFDFLLEDGKGPILVEVKGVTLEREGEVLFPDAPTERGVKHPRAAAGGGGGAAGGGGLRGPDGGPPAVSAQRPDPPRFRPGSAGGRRGRRPGPGLGLPRHPGQPDHPGTCPGCAVGQLRRPRPALKSKRRPGPLCGFGISPGPPCGSPRRSP